MAIAHSGQRASVSIIIPTFNGIRYLPACLKSVIEECADIAGLAEIIVVDNGSTDGTIAYIRREYPAVRIVELGNNLGFAGPCDLGIRLSNAEYCLLMNNDAWFGKGSLASLLEYADSGGYAIVGPTILNPDGTLQCGPISIDFLGDPGDVAIGRESFGVIGAALLVRRSTYLDIGGFDLRFFAYAEEIDLQWRARLRGLRIGRAERCYVYHIGSREPDRRDGRVVQSVTYDRERQYLGRRNTLAMLIKNYSSPALLVVMPLWCLSAAVECLGAALIGQPGHIKTYARAMGWNLRNIRQTWRLHRGIQDFRQVQDWDMAGYFGPPFARLRQACAMLANRTTIRVR